MWQLYWITRLDVLHRWLLVLTVICAIALFLSIVGFILCKSDYYGGGAEEAREEAREWMVFCSKLFKTILPSFILLAILTILIPTTKQALLIYGVGNTIDYIINNETAKQLPDKCINALDAWVESLTQEEKKGGSK